MALYGKIALVIIATVGLIGVLIPIRTRAIWVDPANPPGRPSIRDWVSGMYLTPGTVILIAVILMVAGYMVFRIVRSA